MSRLFAAAAAVLLLCFAALPAGAQSNAPGTIEPPGEKPTVEEAMPPAKAKARPRVRHRHARYRYWRHDPFYYWHPRFWFPFYPHRYHAYRRHRRHY